MSESNGRLSHIGPTKKDKDSTELPPDRGGADGDPDAKSKDGTDTAGWLDWLFGLG